MTFLEDALDFLLPVSRNLFKGELGRMMTRENKLHNAQIINVLCEFLADIRVAGDSGKCHRIALCMDGIVIGTIVFIDIAHFNHDKGRVAVFMIAAQSLLVGKQGI